MTDTSRLADMRRLIERLALAVQSAELAAHDENTSRFDGVIAVANESRAALVALAEDAERLDWLLRKACLAATEDGDEIGLFLTENETDMAFAVIADCTGEDAEHYLTAEDAPFLTDEQRAHINGSIRGATGSVRDPRALRAAIDAARAAHTEVK